jgi:hypothetical protein
MALKAAMWVHHTVVKAEDPRPEFIDVKGWGVHFWGVPENQLCWFHFPITTPVILEDARPQLVKVFVFYKTSHRVAKAEDPTRPKPTSPTVTNLHIYDGPTRVREFNNLNFSGDHSGAIDSSNSWVVTPPLTIFYGLALSVGVFFGGGYGDLYFTTAGADFQS